MSEFAAIAPHLANPLVLVGFVLLLVFGVHRTLLKAGVLQPVSPGDSNTIVQILLRYGFVIAVLVIGLGFIFAFGQSYLSTPPEDREGWVLLVGLAGIVVCFGFAAWFAYPAVLETGAKVDVNAIVLTLTDKHQDQLAAKDEQIAAKDTQIAELTKAVTALVEKSEGPEAEPGAKEALVELAAGHSKVAEEIFQAVLDRKEAEGEAANLEAAEAARHLGALAVLNDTAKALTAYRKASELDLRNLEGWLGLGDAAVAAGDLGEAERAFRQYIALSKEGGEEREESVGLNRLGEVQLGQGALDTALTSYRASLEIAERLAAQDPEDAGWQRDLSVSHNKIGEVQVAQGALDAALASYRASHAIFERLAAQDPGHAGWQRDYAVSLSRLADFPGSGVSWTEVADAWAAMDARGILLPADRQFLEEARQRATAEAESRPAASR